MAQLIVRKLDDSLVKALKVRAAQNRRSAEAEHREILRAALTDTRRGNLKEHLLRIPGLGDDSDFKVHRPRARRVNL